jgi:hypothetical protein
MKPKSITSWSPISSDATRTASMTAYTTTAKKGKPGLIKLLTPAAPPDEATVRKLNELATRPPFCKLHRVKKHDLL